MGKDFRLPVGEPQVGFIAQNLQRILPEAVSVSSGKEAIMSVAELKVVPVLVEAVKALKAANDAQASKIVELNTRLSEQGRRLAQLEARLNNLAAANDNREPRRHLRTAQR